MQAQIISKPENKERITINIQPGQGVLFTFDLSETMFERAGDDLVIQMENGSQLLLEGFFVPGEDGGLPWLELFDGSVVEAVNYLAQANPQMDLTPAAGAPGSGGLGTYADDAGNLVAGLEGSGSLGTVNWASATGFASPAGTGAASPAGAEVPSMTGEPGPGVMPVNPEDAYVARAVFYDTQGQGQYGYFNFHALGSGSLSVKSQYGFIDASSLKVSYDAQGNPVYSLQLSDEGKAAMAEALAVAGGDHMGAPNIYDYITITVGGKSYVMQVVLNQSGHYEAASEDAMNPPATDSGSILGEWHTELKASNGADRITSDGDDEIWFNSGQAGNNSVDMGEGNNTVHAYNRLYAASGNEIVELKSGSGNDVYDLKDNLWAQAGGQVNIDTGAGDDKVNIGRWIYSITGGRVNVSTGDGNDSVTVGGQIYTGADSAAHIDLGGGNNSFASGSSEITANKGQNTIMAADGDNSVNIGGTLNAHSGGINEIRRDQRDPAGRRQQRSEHYRKDDRGYEREQQYHAGFRQQHCERCWRHERREQRQQPDHDR